MKSQKWFDKLDDRMMVLYQMNSAIELGRMQGQLHESQMQRYYRGEGPKPKYDVTPEHKLQRHLEREWKREKRNASKF
jgi:hypothetical protein